MMMLIRGGAVSANVQNISIVQSQFQAQGALALD
jgi:hypothetical protein